MVPCTAKLVPWYLPVPDPTDSPAFDPEALTRLVCPVCHQALALDESFLRCTACGRRYPILDGIPILLANRAS
jgi:uncharacterized protein YbaR (Trm112 family)